ncbi:amino acid adenylation domain-containing protein [Streptomyces sp. NPDC086010]|uniref:amino acid adenylation domain-containing protein n=1 Tax=Streptomyces sp. NPDC086010 TaxID=3365745 RepID=UPI0037D20B2C
MNTPARTGEEYWREVLLAGGSSAVAPWTHAPEPGTAVAEAVVPATLVDTLDGLTTSMRVSRTAPLLAAHARVLSSLTGEPAVTTGYVAEAAAGPLPCRLTTGTGSWRALLVHADQVESELLAHRDFPVEALREELGLPTAAPSTVLDPRDGFGPVRGCALQVSSVRRGAASLLRLRYATDVVDDAYADRILGYHLTALGSIAAAPDEAHGRRSLLSPDEVRHQVDGLAGPRRELPDLRFHELFEQRVRAHPDRVAAVQGERQWTYRQLDERADRVAHALAGEGLGRQDVVAVVAERDLEWLAAVVAVFKAGGVYLPVEPHFPAGRITAMLTRAGCRLVLTGPGSTATLDRATRSLPAVRTLRIGALCEDGDSSGPRVPRDSRGPVAAGDLAYVFFTSGSTGEPKGAMVEHAGMLNHLLAKTADLEIGEDDVVAQTAPQCFDISVWQLLSALLTGGRTLLVGQDAVLDVERFVGTLADGRVTVLQVVPPYLDAVLAFLERHPRELPCLRRVCVTGEALKKDLVRRWFTAMPGIPLVNAYGLTETSDDTNHAVMHRVPDTVGVPIGRPVANVRVYLVDEHLSPVPLGAPGQIAFSGVCVGRGYINDPERTRAAFLRDPHRPGERLHLGGDYGRWLPDGQLEFLGRRDAQVKIDGFRIETGEVENALARTSGVRDAAVVVTGEGGRGRRLAAFYSGERAPDAAALRDRLAGTLPAYMVPSALHRLEALPLTANGKVDRRELSARAITPDATAGREDGGLPRTPTEERLAAAWADVLGVPRGLVGRRDNFFDRGGTSLSAVRVAISLDREVSLKDLVLHPVLTDLASLVDERSAS